MNAKAGSEESALDWFPRRRGQGLGAAVSKAQSTATYTAEGLMVAKQLDNRRPVFQTWAMSKKAIPEDEMLLAEMIAAACANNLVHCVGSRFKDRNGHPRSDFKPGHSGCCAIGALDLVAGKWTYPDAALVFGNDRWRSDIWFVTYDNDRQFLGYAFAVAMNCEGEGQ
jgi:hypothetical protein